MKSLLILFTLISFSLGQNWLGYLQYNNYLSSSEVFTHDTLITVYTVPDNFTNTGLSYMSTSDCFLIGDHTNKQIKKINRFSQLIETIDVSSIATTTVQGVAFDDSDSTIWFWSYAPDASTKRIYHIDTTGTALADSFDSFEWTGGSLDYDSINDYLILRPSGGSNYVHRIDASNQTKIDSITMGYVGLGEGVFYNETNEIYWVGTNTYIFKVNGQGVKIDSISKPDNNYILDPSGGTTGEIEGIIFDPVTDYLVYNSDQTQHGAIPNGNRFWVLDVNNIRPTFSTKGLEEETIALLKKMYVLPSLARQTEINNLIDSLKITTIWDSLESLYVFATETEQQASLNWKANIYNINATIPPTFIINQGYQGNGSSQFLNTTYNPNSMGNLHNASSAMLGLYSRTNQAATVCDMGSQFFSINNCIFLRLADNTHRTRIFETEAVYMSGSIIDSKGFYVANRINSTTVKAYWNGDSLGVTTISTENGVTNGNIYICARNSSNTANLFSSRQYSIVLIGTQLSATNHTILFRLIERYMDNIGYGVVN